MSRNQSGGFNKFLNFIGIVDDDVTAVTYRDLQKRRDIIRERMQDKPKRRHR